MFKNIIINGEITVYSINEYGEIINNKTNKKLKGSTTRAGYHYYRLSISNKKYRYYTHRLVAKYFLSFDDNSQLIINHVDGNKNNNYYKNLEICTHSENILKELKKGQSVKKVLAFKNNIFIGEYYSCSEAARQLDCDSSSISKVCRGIYKHTHGFTFKYKE